MLESPSFFLAGDNLKDLLTMTANATVIPGIMFLTAHCHNSGSSCMLLSKLQICFQWHIIYCISHGGFSKDCTYSNLNLVANCYDVEGVKLGLELMFL